MVKVKKGNPGSGCLCRCHLTKTIHLNTLADQTPPPPPSPPWHWRTEDISSPGRRYVLPYHKNYSETGTRQRVLSLVLASKFPRSKSDWAFIHGCHGECCCQGKLILSGTIFGRVLWLGEQSHEIRGQDFLLVCRAMSSVMLLDLLVSLIGIYLVFPLQWETMAITAAYVACSPCSWPVGQPFASVMSRPPCAWLTSTLSCATSCPSHLYQTTAPSQTLRNCWPKSLLHPHPASLPRSMTTPTPPLWVPSSAWWWCWAFWRSTSDKWRSNSFPH